MYLHHFLCGFFFTFSARFQVSKHARTFNELSQRGTRSQVRAGGLCACVYVAIIINSIRLSFSYRISFSLVISHHSDNNFKSGFLYFDRIRCGNTKTLRTCIMYNMANVRARACAWKRKEEREHGTHRRLCEKKRVFKCIKL